MRPGEIVMSAVAPDPVHASWKPLGVVARGTAAWPKTSLASSRMRRRRISTDSFQSASSWTRPCCMNRAENRLCGWSLLRL